MKLNKTEKKVLMRLMATVFGSTTFTEKNKQRAANMLIKKGLVKRSEKDYGGMPVYAITKKGEEVYQTIKPRLIA